MKKYLISALCLLTLFTVGCAKKDTKKPNNNKKEEVKQNVVLDKQVVNNLTFDHFAITKDANKLSVIFFDITNETTSSIYVKDVNVTLYSDGFEVTHFTEKVGKSIEANETIDVIKNVDVELTGIDEVKYIVNQ